LDEAQNEYRTGMAKPVHEKEEIVWSFHPHGQTGSGGENRARLSLLLKIHGVACKRQPFCVRVRLM